MKRTIIMLVLIFLFTSLSNAQIYKGFGVKVGTSIANQSLSFFSFGTPKYKIGFSAGVFKETHLYEKLSFIAGINYAEKGGLEEIQNYSNSTGSIQGIRTISKYANFFTIELLAKYGGNNDRVSPYILGGLRMDIFSSGKNTFDGDQETLQIYPYSISNNKTFGGTFGLGLNYKISNLLSLFAESTYNPDFTFLGEKTQWGETYNVKNYSFDIKAGIKF